MQHIQPFCAQVKNNHGSKLSHAPISFPYRWFQPLDPELCQMVEHVAVILINRGLENSYMSDTQFSICHILLEVPNW